MPKTKKDPLADAISKLTIDKHSLDDELVRQPILFFDMAQLSATATAERDYAKDQLGLKDAELGSKWRKKLEKRGERPTIQLIEECVLTDAIHIKYSDKYIKSKEVCDKCYAMKESFQQRSYMLRELVSLHISGYYATSAVTSPGRKGSGDIAHEGNKKRLTETRKANRRRK